MPSDREIEAATKALIANCAGMPGKWYPVVAEVVLSAAATARPDWEDVVPTTYLVNKGADPHDWITVTLTCFAGEGPHKPPHDTWAVRLLSYCLNDEGDWEYEPMPSSRDDEFLARTRWPLDEALRRAQAASLGEGEGGR